MRSIWLVPVAALALALGLGVGMWRTTPTSPELTPEQTYAASFADLSGQQQALSQWRGKILVLNFWATWCPPCRQEIPDFIAVYEANRQQGVVIVGIAQDERDLVADFAKEFRVTYPMLIGGDGGYDFSAKLGNSGSSIPFTVILDRTGQVAYVAVGAMHRSELEKQIAKLR